MKDAQSPHLAVVGLGYVGAPLAVELATAFRVTAYDPQRQRIDELAAGLDRTLTLDAQRLLSTGARFTDRADELEQADMFFVCVPTPVDASHRPDLSELLAATRLVGKHLSRGAVVVFESTVYPGATEGVCVPALEAASGLEWKRDFFVAFSPERINPGDQEHTLPRVVKVVSGDSPATTERVAAIYRRIVPAGLHVAPSILVAEMAKLLENTQRDLNVAFVNEAAMLCHRLGIDTEDVLAAARTKWNFLPFHPGLVGGHCVGVDSYYLTHKADESGHPLELVPAGRRVNERMARYVADRLVAGLEHRGARVSGARIIVLGVTFKEDCPDVRNSQSIELCRILTARGHAVQVHDPVADAELAARGGVELSTWAALQGGADALVLAVPHRALLDRGASLLDLVSPGGLVVDVRHAFDRKEIERRGLRSFRL